MKTRRTLVAMASMAALLAATLPVHAETQLFARIAAPVGAAMAPVPDGTPMRVILSLPLGDDAGASAFARAVSDPSSDQYGRYIKPAVYGARFGASRTDYEALRAWAASNGLTVGARTSARTTVSLAGTAGQFAALFATKFAAFDTPLGGGRVMTKAPTLPAALAGRVDGVIGLENIGNRAWLALQRSPWAPSADVGTGINGYAPTDLRTAYNIPPQTNPAPTEVLALFEQGGFPPTDLDTYLRHYHLPNVPVKRVSVNHSSVADNAADIEVDLDLDAAIGMNPSLKQILVYIDSYLQDSFQTALLDGINQIAEDDAATVVNISYSQPENVEGTPAIRAEDRALKQLVAEGITVFASTGDFGAYPYGTNLGVGDPGSQPLVTSVGGTTLRTNTYHSGYVSEMVWNSLATLGAATGGGVSQVWKIPPWQVRNGVSIAVANGGSATMRNIPDIAAVADPYTPYSIYCYGYGGWLGYGGTSLSSPIWAAMATIVNSDRTTAGKPRLGFFNPLLYRVGYDGEYFHDITVGNNGYTSLYPGYSAGPGYDDASGFGSIDLEALLPKLLQ